jgi:hypothetical protein
MTDRWLADLLVAVNRRASDAPAVCWHAAEDRDAAAAGGIRRAQRGADFDDDAGAQAPVSKNSVGEGQISGISCQCEAEPVWCGAMEGLSRSKTGLDLRVRKPNNLAASLNQDLKRRFRLGA